MMLEVSEEKFRTEVAGHDKNWDATCSTALLRISYFRNGKKIGVEETTLFGSKKYYLVIS